VIMYPGPNIRGTCPPSPIAIDALGSRSRILCLYLHPTTTLLSTTSDATECIYLTTALFIVTQNKTLIPNHSNIFHNPFIQEYNEQHVLLHLLMNHEMKHKNTLPDHLQPHHNITAKKLSRDWIKRRPTHEHYEKMSAGSDAFNCKQNVLASSALGHVLPPFSNNLMFSVHFRGSQSPTATVCGCLNKHIFHCIILYYYLHQGGYVSVTVCLSVNNFALCMKFSGKVGNGPMNK